LNPRKVPAGPTKSRGTLLPDRMKQDGDARPDSTRAEGHARHQPAATSRWTFTEDTNAVHSVPSTTNAGVRREATHRNDASVSPSAIRACRRSRAQ
jgi:hypothetical protein